MNNDTNAAEVSTLEWHTLSIEEVCRRLGTNCLRGLSPTQAFRKRIEAGRNVHSPPQSHRFQKLLGYIFGGFGGAMIVAGILCCVAWRPLGEPNPEASYLALGIVLFIVAGLQVFFNAWQVNTTKMSSIYARIGVVTELSHPFIIYFRLILLSFEMVRRLQSLIANLSRAILSKSQRVLLSLLICACFKCLRT
jgi:hypothetical protein